MLQGQDRGGHENGHLLAIGGGLHGCANGNLRLAKAHIATDEAVHRARPLHVGLDFLRDALLVGRVLIGEGSLQFVLEKRVGREGEALLLAPPRVEEDEVAGDVLDFLLRALLHLLPSPRAEAT